MDDKQNNENLPDISGVFDIDENDIPSVVISQDEEASARPKDYEPILLSDPVQQKLDKKEQKKKKAQKKEEKLAEKRKQFKKRVIICAVFVAVVAGAVFGIKAGVDYSRRPTGTIAASYTGSISAHYDTKALLTTTVTEQGQVKTVALFSENDFDVYSISKGLPVTITLENDATAEGRIVSIDSERSDSDIVEKIREAFPDGEYSSGNNWVITIETDLGSGVQDNTVADISIMTSISDNAVLVPASAVHKIGARKYVWVYKPFSHTAQRQEVSVGIESDGIAEITKDLKEDTNVVAEFSCGDDALSEKMKIKAPKD